MRLSFKKIIILSIAVLLPFTLTCCQSKSTDTISSALDNQESESYSIENQNNTKQDTEQENTHSHDDELIDTSADKKQPVVQDNGYAVCRLQDYSGDVLVILSHAAEVNRQFEFYLIKNDELENIGALDGTDITAYISDDTKCLCICRTNNNIYNLGAVKYKDGIIVDWTDTIINEKTNTNIDYPGKIVSFKSTDSSEFKNKYAEKITYAEELDEIVE